MTVIKDRIWPGLLVLLMSSTSCVSNTMEIREEFQTLWPSYEWDQNLTSIKRATIFQSYFHADFFTIIFFSCLQCILFLCIKNHFPSSGEIFPIPCPLYSQLPWPSFYLSFHTIHSLGCFQTNVNFSFVLILFVAWKTKHINLKQTLNCLWG